MERRAASQEASSASPPPIVSIVGRSGSGKTTLLEKLIRELKQRGYRLAVIKHHHQRGLELDEPGKDTWRFAQAGADHIVLAGPDKVAHIRTFSDEPTLEQIASTIRDVDLILTEGYKRGSAPKIEVVRGEPGDPLVSDSGDLIAVASDGPVGQHVPRFKLGNAKRLADFVEACFLR